MNKKHWLLINCFAATLGAHCAALLVYVQYPHLFQPRPREHINPQALMLSWDAEMKNKEIDDAFSRIIALSPPETSYERHLLPAGIEQTPREERASFGTVDLLNLESETFRSSATISIEENVLFSELQAKPLSILEPSALQKSGSVQVGGEIGSWGTLFDSEENDLAGVAPSIPDIEPDSLFVSQPPSAALETDNAVSLSPRPLEDPALSVIDPVAPFVSSQEQIQKTPAPEKGALPHMGAYSLVEDLPQVGWRNEFNIDVKLLPQEKNFLFSISLTPTVDLSLSRLKQNFFFLIDRSNSIEKHRYQVFKRAVLKALSFLRAGDTFNIFILDQEITRLSNENLLFNPATLQRAETFLEKQGPGGLFSATDIYSVLEKLSPSGAKDHELYTAILLTDGDSLLSANKQRKTILRWMERNGGKLALFTAAVGKGNNLPLLEMLSGCNRGKLLYSETYAAFPRKLAKMVHDLRNPIATDLRISTISSREGDNIVLYPASSYAPNLYIDQPYVLTGSATTPSDFTLLIEGKHNGQWISLEKKISFQSVQKGGAELKANWAKSNAYYKYQQFLQSGNLAFLEDAKALLNKQ